MSKIMDTLNNDSLREVEKITNKHWSNFNEDEQMLSMMIGMMDNMKKESILKEVNDTHYSIEWNEYKALLVEHGFIEGYSEQYEYSNFGHPCTEEVVMHYHPEKYLTVWTQSYSNMRSINGGTLYGYFKGETFGRVCCSHGGLRPGEQTDFSMDVREGLFSKLNELQRNGEFVNGWKEDKNRFLWFLKLDEDKIEDYNYKELTNEKISKFTKEAKGTMGR